MKLTKTHIRRVLKECEFDPKVNPLTLLEDAPDAFFVLKIKELVLLSLKQDTLNEDLLKQLISLAAFTVARKRMR